VLNVTATGARGPGYLTVHPCAVVAPAASTLGFGAGTTVSNVAVTPIDASHKVCVHASEAVHVVVDLDGAVGGAGLVTQSPARIFDTRVAAGRGGAGTISRLALATPSGTAAALVNIAVTAPSAPGYLSAYPCDAPVPATSTLNFDAGQTVATFAVATVSAAGELCILQSTATHVFVDLEGWFTSGSAYRPVAAARLLDTRASGGPPVPADTVRRIPLGPGSVASFVTVVVDQAARDGYVTAYPCASARPVASNVNPVAGRAVASAVFVAGDELCLVGSTSAHLVVDRFGVFPAGGFVPAGPVRLRDTRDDGVA
jgi:hypothetical protein